MSDGARDGASEVSRAPAALVMTSWSSGGQLEEGRGQLGQEHWPGL